MGSGVDGVETEVDGVDGVETEVDGVEKGINGVETAFDGVGETGVDGVETAFDGVGKTGVDGVEAAFDGVEELETAVIVVGGVETGVDFWISLIMVWIKDGLFFNADKMISSLILSEKIRRQKHRRGINQLCYCKVCQGRKTQSLAVISRHLETYGQSLANNTCKLESSSSSSEDEQPASKKQKRVIDLGDVTPLSSLQDHSAHVEKKDANSTVSHVSLLSNSKESFGNPVTLHADLDQDVVVDPSCSQDQSEISNSDTSTFNHEEIDTSCSDASDYEENDYTHQEINPSASDVSVHQETNNDREEIDSISTSDEDSSDHSTEDEDINDIYNSEKALLPLYQGSDFSVLEVLQSWT
ncbi:hypothetical protein AC249_AIPGENE26451 [Exaiptasia diaphana]|nr:hypothetical protein AC249_AIPGENE26451 [Exaiptasia diaphana]